MYPIRLLQAPSVAEPIKRQECLTLRSHFLCASVLKCRDVVEHVRQILRRMELGEQHSRDLAGRRVHERIVFLHSLPKKCIRWHCLCGPEFDCEAEAAVCREMPRSSSRMVAQLDSSWPSRPRPGTTARLQIARTRFGRRAVRAQLHSYATPPLC